MIEQNKVIRFYIAVQQLLEGGQIEPETAMGEDLLLIKPAQEIARHDTRSKIQIERSLRQALLTRVSGREEPRTAKGSKHMKTFPPHPKNFLLPVPLALISVLLLVTLTVPPIRALAQDIIHRIGNFSITNKPSDFEQYAATLESGTPTPTPNADCEIPGELIIGRLTAAEASAKAGFAICAPPYLPKGSQLSTRDVLAMGQSTTISAGNLVELDPPLHDRQQMRGIIAITQSYVYSGEQSWEKGVGGTPIVDVTVGGLPADWLEQVPIYPFQDEQGKWNYARWNQLIWAEAGHAFLVQTNVPADFCCWPGCSRSPNHSRHIRSERYSPIPGFSTTTSGPRLISHG